MPNSGKHTDNNGSDLSLYYARLNNAVDYLERAYDAARTLPRDAAAWKWLVLSLHSALYSFGVCVVHGNNYDLVSTVTKGGKRRLLGFGDVIKRCQGPEYVGFYTHSRPLKLTTEQRDSIGFLKGVRDQIEHYVPKQWNVEQHGVVTAAVDAFDVVKQMAFETGNVRLSTEQKRRVEVATTKGSTLLRNTQLYREFLTATKLAARRNKP